MCMGNSNYGLAVSHMIVLSLSKIVESIHVYMYSVEWLFVLQLICIVEFPSDLVYPIMVKICPISINVDFIPLNYLHVPAWNICATY